MAHIRQQLREKIKTLLESATSRHVSLNRTNRFSPNQLPGIIVTTPNESVDQDTFNSSTRDIELTIQVHEKAYSDVDDKLDAICLKIEKAINDDKTINSDGIYLNATNIDIEDGDQPIGVATMIYTATFIGVTEPEQVI